LSWAWETDMGISSNKLSLFWKYDKSISLINQ
jgi:hypothetical protein